MVPCEITRPWAMTTTGSHSRSTTASSCSIISIVSPSPTRSARCCSILRARDGFTPAIGSPHNRRVRGGVTPRLRRAAPAEPPPLGPPVQLAERRLPQRLAPLGRRRDQQVLQYGQRGELTGELKGADDPAPGHLVGGQSGDVLPPIGNRPSARLERTGDDVGHGRLPGAVGPDQAGNPAGRNAKGRAVHPVHPAELAMQVLNGEHGNGEVAHFPVPTGTSSLAATGKRRRRSGITPRGQNPKKTRASAPTTIHCRASMSPAGPN